MKNLKGSSNEEAIWLKERRTGCLVVFAGGICGGDPGDIAEDAVEMQHSGKAGARGDMGDFHLGFFEQLGCFLQSAGVELLAKELSGGCLYARGDLIKRQLHNIGDVLSRADLPSVPHFYDGYYDAKTGYSRVLIYSSQRRCRTPV